MLIANIVKDIGIYYIFIPDVVSRFIGTRPRQRHKNIKY